MVVGIIKISTKGRYGLRAIIYIGLYEDESPIPMTEIAQREKISKEYLEQILFPLKKAGLIRSRRGPKGVYMLAEDPKEVTAGDILRILEGSLEPVKCAKKEFNCEQQEECVVIEVWQHLSDEIHDTLNSYTLAGLIERGRELKFNKD